MGWIQGELENSQEEQGKRLTAGKPPAWAPCPSFRMLVPIPMETVPVSQILSLKLADCPSFRVGCPQIYGNCPFCQKNSPRFRRIVPKFGRKSRNLARCPRLCSLRPILSSVRRYSGGNASETLKTQPVTTGVASRVSEIVRISGDLLGRCTRITCFWDLPRSQAGHRKSGACRLPSGVK